MLVHHSTLVTERLFRPPFATDRHVKRRQNTALHSLSLSSSYRAAADIACSCTAQRGQNCLSQLLAPPRTVKVVAFSVSHREDGQCTSDSSTICLPHVLSHMCLPQYGLGVSESQWRSPAMATSLPRDGYYLLSLTPPRTRIGGGCSCEMWEHGAATRHTLKVRVECSTKRQAKSTRP